MPDSGLLSPGQPPPQIGSYRLLQRLGSGGMSSVFRAVHLETGHVVALKVLPRTLAKNPTFLQRFLREAKSAEALEDPNIVAIYDRGVEDGRYYLVLEYVPGGDLHDWVRDRGPLPAEQVVEVLKGVARGLRHAASRGMIHRDIKPANLLRTEDGRVKITDLGLALQLEEEDERVTRDGTTVGTVDYMAPEQARDSRATSVRSDIYSLGCTAFYLLTGQPPFAGGDVPSKLRRHALEPPPDPRSIRPEVPPALARLVLRMMAKKPEERFADHDDLLAALDRLALGAAEDEPVLTALIDEEDEPIATALIDEDDEEPPSAIALIDEDESSDFVVGRPGTVRPDGAAPVTKAFPPPGRPAVPAEIDLIELAAIEEDEDRPAARPAARPRPVESVPPPPLDLFDLEPEPGAPMPTIRRRAGDDSLQTWILRGVMAGVVIVVIGFGLLQLIFYLGSTPRAETTGPGGEGRTPPEVIIEAPPETEPEPRIILPRKEAPAPPSRSPVAETWVEPAEPGPPAGMSAPSDRRPAVW